LIQDFAAARQKELRVVMLFNDIICAIVPEF